MNQQLLESYKDWMMVIKNNSDKTVELMLKYTKWFLEWLDSKGIDIKQVNQDIVNAYIIDCKKKYSKNTMVTITSNLRKLLIHFLKRRNLEIKVMKISPPQRDKTPLTKKEIEAIFEVAKDKPLDEAILKTLYYTGMRKFELVSLNIEDVDFENLKITIRHGKGNTYRVVNITRDCAMAIRRWLAVRATPEKGHEKALFISVHNKRISESYIRDITKRYAIEAGIEKPVYPHKFRITNITHMAEHGLDIKEIQAQSGHKNITTLMEYIQYNSDKIRKSYESVFEKDNEQLFPKKTILPEMNHEYYMKLLIQRYLDKEIDKETFITLLEFFEKPATNKSEKPRDVAYW